MELLSKATNRLYINAPPIEGTVIKGAFYSFRQPLLFKIAFLNY